MEDSIRLGRILGIRVGLNWSLLLVFLLIAWSLANGLFRGETAGQSDAAYWIAGVVAAILFLASLLGHELAHAVVAQRLGVRVEGITLWLFGGVARLGGGANSPRSEIAITIVGPLTSLILGGLFLVLGQVFGGTSSLAGTTAAWLGRINLILGVFNLLPAFPLDGGRILRALLWLRRGDIVRATVVAARAGRVFGFLLIALGIADFFLSGSVINGLWSVFLGWFLLTAARAEESDVLMRQALAGIRVGQVMTPNPVQAPDYITVAELLDRYVFAHRFATFPVHDFGGQLTGVVTMSRIKSVPVDRRATTRVREVACPISEAATANVDDQLVDILGRMDGCSEGRVLVLSDGNLAGIVSPRDITRILEWATVKRREGTPVPLRGG
jgi:Zn-dependent protease/CBS domain-containing protein